ncbi:Nucleotide-binding protein [Glarea lozoyensis ATCC 20868]|uniref:Nucleotide-binding protein n=1 Tax=Glarea lozoyensis (strain ATCC 20868 / MF5171) TaxID=1116229 RepID=S3CV94_GLAL2|nr:Nucleotide-binding protein [Glarea lozoyensis ATCC 20868]EPE28879.1 Nucleotide-binding protein [Glarea lozoyensis ATCC 20868]
MSKPKIAIVGAGITGLACAYVLASRYNVTIIARDLPGDLGLAWASPWAGAVFHPQNTTNPLLRKMQEDSFRFYWDLAKREDDCGVGVYHMTEFFENEEEVWYKDLMSGWCEGKRGVEGLKVREYETVCMNPEILLLWLRKRLEGTGVRFVRREVESLEHAKSIVGAQVVVNASGVGARELAHDEAVRPVRGQTMFVKTDFAECVMLEGSEYTYVIPRKGSGGVIMGGVKSERLDADIDVDLRSDILRRVNRLTGDAFGGLDVEKGLREGKVRDVLGFRPGRKGGVRVERVGGTVHAYGVEGAGYIYSFGVAVRVGELVEEVLKLGRKAKL